MLMIADLIAPLIAWSSHGSIPCVGLLLITPINLGISFLVLSTPAAMLVGTILKYRALVHNLSKEDDRRQDLQILLIFAICGILSAFSASWTVSHIALR
jgi:hypothetical protein